MKIVKPIVYAGTIRIDNVPHEKQEEHGHVEYFLRSSVSLKTAAIAEYMKDHNITYFDFEDFDKYPEIQEQYINRHRT